MTRPLAQRWLYFASLVLAAESIYMLPYLRKTFQTSMESAFGLDAVDIGSLNSMFGLAALASYFPGGWLADRISARKLLAFSLLTTGLGGFYMATIPSHNGLLVLYLFWGTTSILTFWAALIKAVRNCGGAEQQGTGFGLFEAGRGIVAASLTSLATLAYAFAGTATEGLITVILFYSIAALISAGLVWILIPDDLYGHQDHEPASNGTATDDAEPAHWTEVLSYPRTWFLAAVIFCAYFLYLGTFDFPAYAERGFGQTKLFGAELGTFRDWLRPFAAICAGLIADRLQPSRVVFVSFATIFVSYLSLAMLPAGSDLLWLFWVQVAAAALAAFALRAVYFALLQETGVPLSQTGMTVGFVSVIAYAPDLFAHTLAGTFVDSFGLATGYRWYYGFLSVFAALGILALWRLVRRREPSIAAA